MLQEHPVRAAPLRREMPVIINPHCRRNSTGGDLDKSTAIFLLPGRMHVWWLATYLHLDHHGSAIWTAGAHLESRQGLMLTSPLLAFVSTVEQTRLKLILPPFQMSRSSYPTFESPTGNIGCRMRGLDIMFGDTCFYRLSSSVLCIQRPWPIN